MVGEYPVKIQITLTVPEAKRIIAKGIASKPEVKNALQHGNILLKGGTTVSALCEELTGHPLRIGGRITPKGTMNALHKKGGAHCLLINKSEAKNVDETVEDVTSILKKDDVIIVGANALDVHGSAAMMAAAPLGSHPGKAISGFMSQGTKVIVAVGLEKLIVGNIRDAVMACGRESIDRSFGSAIGLIPIFGEVVTELEAIELLANVKATMIGAGGILGAEGATTSVVEGPDDEVKRVFQIVSEIKGARTSGTSESLIECEAGCPQCARHLACIYREAGPRQGLDRD